VEWKTIVYVNVDKTNEIHALRRYLHHILCPTPNSLKIKQLASIIIMMLGKKLQQLTETEEFFKQITGCQAITDKVGLVGLFLLLPFGA
jgi:hypothetical protein